MKNKRTTGDDSIWKVVCNFTHKDLVKESVLRGIEFEHILKWSHPKIMDWFYKNYDNSQDPSLLIQYDLWMDEQLQKDGKDKVFPSLKLGYIEKLDFDGKISNKPLPKTKEEKQLAPPKEKNTDWGINTGTKKYLTYESCITNNLNIEDTIKRVIELYPDADDKSIKIWYKRAEKLK